MTALIPKLFSQIFIVDPAVYPVSMSIVSTHLCFLAKDDQLPITLRIHPVINGIPDTSTFIPGAECTLTPAQINICDGVTRLPNLDDDTIGTRFVFTRPVTLAPGSYAIVVDTLSPYYRCFMGAINLPILGGTRAVSRPTHVGSFFRTQNTAEWVEDLTTMLMFKHKIAQYVTTPQYYTFPVLADPLLQHAGSLFHFDCNTVLPGASIIGWTYRAGYFDGTFDVVDVACVPKTNIIPPKQIVVPPNSNNGFNITATCVTTDPNVSPVVDPTRLNVTLTNYIINNGQLANNLINIINPGSYANTNASSTPTVTISAPQANGGITATAVATVSLSGGINVVSNIVFSNVGSGYYETPTITLSFPSGTLINATANISGETGASGGNALARYITRKVVLADGFDATDLRVWMTCNKQAGMDVQVYYKILSSLDPNQNFDARPWTRMVLAQNSTVVSQNNLDYIEYTWQDANSPSISYTSPGGYKYTNFKVFAVKVCMYAASNQAVPSCKDLRVLALA